MRWQQTSESRRRLRILTWHVHGNYLHALTQLPHDFVIPVLPGTMAGYSRLGPALPWGRNIRQVPVQQIHEQELDCVIYQSRRAFESERYRLLTPEQLKLPSIYIEHNPPEPHPTDTVHWFHHDRGVLIHVTHHNALMWDAPAVTTRVIEHGLVAPPVSLFTGELPRGITVVNHLRQRGRRVGADIYQQLARQVPLDLIGMASEDLDGLGEIPNQDVPGFIARYRFFFSPVRYASLGLSIVEAMMAGLPVVGLAVTELPNVITNGVNGWLDSRPDRLVDCMRQLIAEPETARQWGQAARELALSRFSIGRFIDDWNHVLAEATRQADSGVMA